MIKCLEKPIINDIIDWRKPMKQNKRRRYRIRKKIERAISSLYTRTSELRNVLHLISKKPKREAQANRVLAFNRLYYVLKGTRINIDDILDKFPGLEI